MSRQTNGPQPGTVEDLNARVREALQRTEIMALSTVGADGPWTSPVQYRHDGALHIFFLSQAGTKHGTNIGRDARVSAAIYSHPGPPGGNLGLQIRGAATLLSDDPAPGGWLQYRITPTEVWCFDSRVFGGGRRQVDLTRLDLADRADP